MQRRLTKKLSDTLRRDYEEESAHVPTKRQLPAQPTVPATSRPGLPGQGQQEEQYGAPPRSVLLSQGQQAQYNQQSRRPKVPQSSYLDVPEAAEENRSRSRNAAFLPSADQSLQNMNLPARGKSQPGPSKSSESTRQGRSDSGRPIPWRSNGLREEESESNDLLSTVSDDFSYELEADASASEDFAQSARAVSSEVLADDEAYESDFESTVLTSRSRSSARKPQKSSQSVSDGNKKPAKKSSKSSSASRKQSKSKSISFSRERDSKGKRSSSRDKYVRSGDPENSSGNNPRSVSSSNRRAIDYSGRATSFSAAPASPRGSQALAGSSMSREVMALPIEIPESVTDADAFRRYLSRTESYMEPIGGSGVRPGRTATNLNAQLTQGMAVHRRTVALSHAIMTLALLSASASQLRFVVAYANAHSYPALNYFLICSCIAIEIFVGIGYVVISRVDFSDVTLEKVHSYLIFGLFFVAISNVILAAFALDDHVCEVLAKRTEQYDNIEPPPPPLSAQSQPLPQSPISPNSATL